MKIGKVDVKISIVSIAVFVFFTLVLIVASLFSPEIRTHLFWLIPVLFLLLVIPVVLSHMSRSQYAELEPEYERQAKTVRVKLINENMIGKIVRIDGVVERVHFQFMNRPQYSIADRSGAISVKMFTSPDENIKVNDVVEVLGQVIRRYIVTGEPVINCVSIRKKSGLTRKDD
ncbi:MAG: nucleotide-binding protein [Methanomicrobiales archaeon HGW-Methanomicrobiales-5]|nr:MAG: nucleotide-binding protein [Methanomicrobiales archaeon HGW-Methanomicrobiales-5]